MNATEINPVTTPVITPILKKTVSFNNTVTNKSPSLAAKETAKKALLSLHPSIAEVIEKHVDYGISTTALVFRATTAAAKLVDKDFIPRSLRINFKLKSSSRIANNASFIKEQEESDVILNKCIAELKIKINKTQALELEQLQKDFIKNIFNATAFLIKTLPLVDSGINLSKQTKYILLHRITDIKFINDLLNTLEYKRETVYADCNIVPDGDVPQVGELDNAEQEFQCLVTKLFIDPLTTFTNTTQTNNTTSALRKLAKLHSSEKHHDDVVEMLESEQSISHEILDKLIDDKVNKQMKKLTKTFKTTSINPQPKKRSTSPNFVKLSNKNLSNNSNNKDKKSTKHNNSGTITSNNNNITKNKNYNNTIHIKPIGTHSKNYSGGASPSPSASLKNKNKSPGRKEKADGNKKDSPKRKRVDNLKKPNSKNSIGNKKKQSTKGN